MAVISEDWEPPSSFEEKMKSLFVQPQLYIWYKAQKELKKGEAEIKLLPFLAPADQITLDIGANKGVWSYMLSPQCSQVHAFEPNPKMFKILERCGNPKITVHKIALSNETKKSELLVPYGGKIHQTAVEKLIGTVYEYGYEPFALNGGALTKFGRALASDHRDHYGNYLFNFIFLPKN